MTLDESKIDPLWRLDKVRQEDGKIVLTSSVTPPPTAEQIDLLVNKLMGTNLRIEAVQAELKLEDWPPDYLSFQLRNRLAIVNGHWIDAELARGASRPTGNN